LKFEFAAVTMLPLVALPCILFEDEHLLVVNKPAGLNTHSPSPYAGEGIYEWLREREARWARLAIVHRLDKDTSGVMVFSKSAVGNKSLTEQFARRFARKRYVLLTDRAGPQREVRVKSWLARVGERYVSRPFTATTSAGAKSSEQLAETVFRPHDPAESLGAPVSGLKTWAVDCEPLTGRTHQIRVHAAQQGFHILGDTIYGGRPAGRVYLHAAELGLEHPGTRKRVVFRTAPEFEREPRAGLREAIIEPDVTNAYRVINGASDGWPGWYVERLGSFLLSQSEKPLSQKQRGHLEWMLQASSGSSAITRLTGAYHKVLRRKLKAGLEMSPEHVLGETAPERFGIIENGISFEISFKEGYSVGLFVDQRDNRRRLLNNYVGAQFGAVLPAAGRGAGTQRAGERQDGDPTVLNAFAYTCGFSVCAAKAGAQVTSLDLSKNYLEWGRRNFELNQLNPAEHDFIYGDVFDWFGRLAKKERLFDLILLDPPTFSQSKASGVFRVEKDYGKLVEAALRLLKRQGVLFASSNAAGWRPEEFLAAIEGATARVGRKVLQRQFVPQPPDFPISREEAGYLKTVWMRIG
jgi:23S rRNA (cytosine1962-C5)-methyltransferase